MSLVSDLMGAGGIPGQAATYLGTYTPDRAPVLSVATGLTATGTVIGDALQLTKIINAVGTTALSTGVKLPQNVAVGQFILVSNGGANPLNLFPPTSSQVLNGAAAGGALTIAAGAANICFRISATNWQVYVLAFEA